MNDMATNRYALESNSLFISTLIGLGKHQRQYVRQYPEDLLLWIDTATLQNRVVGCFLLLGNIRKNILLGL